MSDDRFRVDEVFDIPTRGGLLVVGTFVAGQPVGVPLLRDAITGHLLRVLGVEFATPRTLRTGQTTFVLDRSHREYAVPGREWLTDG